MSLLSGIVFGLSAGLAPGPLLALVLGETMRHGVMGGIRVAFAPLVTDLPIVALTLLLISRMAGSHLALGLISLAGAVFLLYQGHETFMTAGLPDISSTGDMHSLRKGVITNFLNPHPYLFWLTVGSPMVIRASVDGIFPAAAFLGGFYTFLVGSKVALAAMADKGRHLLSVDAYRFCMRALGLLLWVFAAILAGDAVRFLQTGS